jgi:hypothetical protein
MRPIVILNYTIQTGQYGIGVQNFRGLFLKNPTERGVNRITNGGIRYHIQLPMLRGTVR